MTTKKASPRHPRKIGFIAISFILGIAFTIFAIFFASRPHSQAETMIFGISFTQWDIVMAMIAASAFSFFPILLLDPDALSNRES